MPNPSSWRDLLKEIIADPVGRKRLATAVGIHLMTLARWVSGEASPRSVNLRQLLSTLPYEQRTRLAALLEGVQLDLSELSLSESLVRSSIPL